MKTFIYAGAAIAALAAMPALAVQQAPVRPAPQAQPMTRATVQTMVQTHFAQADADRDGFVTKAEAEASIGAMRARRQTMRAERRDDRFARLDANGDGSISRAEFDAPRAERSADRAVRKAQRAERRADRMERRGDRRHRVAMRMGGRFGANFFERADSDKDGRISLAEATAHPLARFDRIDANKDGTVSIEERRAMRALRTPQRAD